MHSRQQSLPVQPTYESAYEDPSADQQQQQQQPVATSFWLEHNIFSSVVHDIMLWERPIVTAGTYIALIWLFFVIRAMVPDESSSTLVVVIVAVLMTIFLLAGQSVVSVLKGSLIFNVLCSLPELLIAEPRDENSKNQRAALVDNTLNDINSRVKVFLVQLNLAEYEADITSITLTMIGKIIIGFVCVLLAFVFSMFETRTLVITFVAIVILLPPVIRYDVIHRVVDALSTASNQPRNGQPAPNYGNQEATATINY